jgi:hypothetical protein
MGNLNLRKSESENLQEQSQSRIDNADIQNLFSYLKQEVNSSDGLVQKTKTLSNILLNNRVFDYMISQSIKKHTKGGIRLGSEKIEGFNYTGIHTVSEKEEHYSIYAKFNEKDKSLNLPGIVKGFLLRKEKSKKFLKSILEARLVMFNGKECTLKYDYTLSQ